MPNSSKISKAAEIWAEKYPDIKIEGYDLGGDDVLSKTVGEQESGMYVGDVWFSSGGAELVGNVLPHEYVWRFVPHFRSKCSRGIHPPIVDVPLWHHASWPITRN